MTSQERQMLLDLANKIAQTPAPQRDPEAEELIRTRIGSRPDALYLMTQTVLIQNLALDHAKQQIQELQSRAGQSAPPPQQSGASMFGQTPGAPPSAQPPSSQAAGPSGPVMPQPAAAGQSSFLRSAATTAAGVAAGALAFEGIRSLFSGAEHLFGSGGGQGSGFLGGGLPPSETIVNNYYDSPDAASTDAADDNSPDADDSDQSDSGDSDRDDSLTDDSYTDDSSSSDDLV